MARNRWNFPDLGFGIGLLISDRLNKDQRKAAGWALFGMGLVTTIPILAGILGKGISLTNQSVWQLEIEERTARRRSVALHVLDRKAGPQPTSNVISCDLHRRESCRHHSSLHEG